MTANFGGLGRLPSPREIVQALDQHVVGQPLAKKVRAAFARRHASCMRMHALHFILPSSTPASCCSAQAPDPLAAPNPQCTARVGITSTPSFYLRALLHKGQLLTTHPHLPLQRCSDPRGGHAQPLQAHPHAPEGGEGGS